MPTIGQFVIAAETSFLKTYLPWPFTFTQLNWSEIPFVGGAR